MLLVRWRSSGAQDIGGNMTRPGTELDSALAARCPITDRQGVACPARFSSVDAEYRAITEGVALASLPWLAHLRATGQHRERFLNNLTTCRVKGLGPGQGAYGATLTHKGKLVGQLQIDVEPESILLEMEVARREPIREHIQRHIVADRVAFAPVNGLDVLALVGPRAGELLARVAGETTLEVPAHGHLERSLQGHPVRLRANPGRLGLPGWDLVVADPALAIWEVLETAGATPVGLEAWEIARVEAGVPADGLDVDDTTMPLESPALARGITWDKGCYLGQEVVCMARDLGQPNKQLVLLAVGEAPGARGTELVDPKDGKPVGRLGTRAISPLHRGAVALALVRHRYAAPGTRLALGGASVEVIRVADGAVARHD
jgi:folate-binding protein YgfZ